MITLHRIHATNFRSLGDAVFEPLVDGGMTALNGPNGAGKSSLLTAMVWALYGALPDGVKTGSLRRQGSEGPVRVVVEFLHDQQTIVVERGLKGARDAAYMQIWLDGTEKAFGKIGACEAWLVERLGGLDAQGFLTAFVVRQKEIDDLVTAKPAERRRLIEGLAGIDRMSTAIKTARAEEAATKVRLEALPGSNENLKAAEQALTQAQEAATSLWEQFEAARDRTQVTREAHETARAAADDLALRMEAHRVAERAVVTAQHAHEMAKAAAAHAHTALNNAMRDAEGGSPEDVAAAQASVEQARTKVEENAEARRVADQAIERAEAEAARARRESEAAAALETTRRRHAAEVDRLRETVAQFPADAEDALAAAVLRHETALNDKASLLAQYKALEASLAAMNVTGDTSCCPTCKSDLADPDAVRAELTSSLDDVRARGMAAKSTVENLEGEVRAAQAIVNQVHQVTPQLVAAETNLAEASSAAQAAHETAETAHREAQAAHDAAEAAKKHAHEAAAQTATLRQTMQATEQRLVAAQTAAKAHAQVPSLRQAAQDADGQVQDAHAAVIEAQHAEEQSRVSAQEQSQITSAATLAEKAHEDAVREASEANTAFKVAETQVAQAEKTAETERTLMAARRETLAEYEVKTATRECLDEFRRERIASLAPELSEIATDFVSSMTEGRYISVELDEEFTPILTDSDGNRRQASWLSGGEVSAVALALRLAIGEVIAGTAGGLLWMDEPQTAMDSARRPAMMRVIGGLPGRQPILISHVTEATDQVDLVLEVVPDAHAGSCVVPGGTAQAVDFGALAAVD